MLDNFALLYKVKIMAEENKTIVKEEIPEEQKKFTLNVWVKGIVHYKWWVIGATLGLGVIGLLNMKLLLLTSVCHIFFCLSSKNLSCLFVFLL